MKKRDSVCNLHPRRRESAIASPYTEKDNLTESEKKERSNKFCSSPLKDKYFKL